MYGNIQLHILVVYIGSRWFWWRVWKK